MPTKGCGLTSTRGLSKGKRVVLDTGRLGGEDGERWILVA